MTEQQQQPEERRHNNTNTIHNSSSNCSRIQKTSSSSTTMIRQWLQVITQITTINRTRNDDDRSCSSSKDSNHNNETSTKQGQERNQISSSSSSTESPKATTATISTKPSSSLSSSFSSASSSSIDISPLSVVQNAVRSTIATTPQDEEDTSSTSTTPTHSRSTEAMKQLLCGGIAGSVAKTITAPFSRLTILFQVHSLVTTKGHRPKFATSLSGGVQKIIERGGIRSLWRGNMTSVLHRFPYSAINFYMYENTMDLLASTASNNSNHATTSSSTDHPNAMDDRQRQQVRRKQEEDAVPQKQLVRRMTRLVMRDVDDNDDTTSTTHTVNDSTGKNNHATTIRQHQHSTNGYNKEIDTPAIHKFIAGAVAGTTACTVCYPLDLVRTRLTTELEGHEHYRGIYDAFRKIYLTEGVLGFYSGLVPTLLVAVPNFGISYTVYGTLKEYTLDDELFYNLRKIDADSGETKLGFGLTILCGAASGILATLVTFPMDTIRRRMQVQSLHVHNLSHHQLTSYQTASQLIQKEGLTSLYRGLTPEILKVIPMVGTMFMVYETTKDMLNVTHERNK